MIWLLALLVAPSEAARCAAMDDQELRTLITTSQGAIDRGDVELLEANLAEIETNVPCLVYAPPPRLWAEVLVLEAIHRFQSEEDWESSLSTALHLHPYVDRGVGGQHPIALFEAPEPPEPGAPLPEGIELTIDGSPSRHLPPDTGRHLVQRPDGRWWASTIVEEEPLDPGFLEGSVEPPPRIATEFRISFFGGYGQTLQADARTGSGTDFVVPSPERGGAGGLAGSAEATFYVPFGVRVEAYALPSGRALASGIRAFAIYARRRFFVGSGPTIMLVESFPGDVHQTHQPAIPSMVVGLRSDRVHASLRGGYRPFFGQAGLRLSYSWTTSPLRPIVGLLASGWRATMAQATPDQERLLHVTTVRAGLTFGLRWGTL